MLRTLDRYIIRETLAPFGLTLLILTFLLQIPTIMDVAEKLIAKGVTLPIIGRIVLTLLPSSLAITIPISLLVGLLMALGRLSADREAVAMQACGVSLYRILRPVLLMAVVATAVTAYTMMEAMPRANQTFRDITFRIIQAKAESDVRPRVFFEEFPNLVLYVRDVPSNTRGWKGVFLADTRKPGETQLLTADRGHFVLEPAQRRVDLILEDGILHRSTLEAPAQYELQQFDALTVQLDPETVFPRQGLTPGDNEMTIPQLRTKARQMREQGLSPHNPIMAIQRKYTIPAACLVFGLIALVLGVSHRKDGKNAGFVIGIAVVLVYYVLMYVGTALAKGHQVPAEFALWIPNVVLGGAGVVLLVLKTRGYEFSPSIRIPIPEALARLLPRATAETTDGSTPRASSAIASVGNSGSVPAGTPAATPAATAVRSSGRKQVVVVIKVPQGILPSFNLLDRYLSRIYLRVFGVTFLGMLAVFYIAIFTDYSEYLFKGKTTGQMLLSFFLYSTPQYTYYITALAALVGTLVTVGLLTRTSELTVMQACGVSLYRATVPMLLFGLAWSVVLFGMEQSILAASNRRAEELKSTIRTGMPRPYNLASRQWMAGSNGELYHYGRFDTRTQRLEDLTVYTFGSRGWNVTGRTFARVTTHMNAHTWRADLGWQRSFGDRNAVTAFSVFPTRTVSMETPDYFGVEEPEAVLAERMKVGQLRQHIAELDQAGYNSVPLQVALHRKMAFPFITLIMTLIAIPFGVTTGRKGTLFGIGIGIVLAILYWTTQSLFAAVGSAGAIAPPLAAWAPNILFIAVAAYLVVSART
ncbi:lipopolysaccharide ABC transporter permease [Luteitalea pratensis]|uniref:Lipopolysaccharide ABC transporter permease n=1 Tax=Luteitalea pratensis TaxID=1855912 RepID=A0A143PNV7_LUTPR|nr:LptF/LptG family permease [Luteitalea pratensis]AMY10275.1 lipopolysaccharide ABC transporter permease [Luteitalea pratensis]